ncbi:MAG: translocation/assembly module TamB [Parachlamydiaceae bacterium]|nr:translocation/assembly module TamB [Parachlamydiaceae bacterium]
MLRFRDIGQFLLLLPILLIALMHTDLGSYIIKKQIENELSSRAQAKVRIRKFDFSWPKQLIFQDLTVENAEVQQLSIREIKIDTSLTALLTGSMADATLNLEGISVMQAEISQLTAQCNFNDLTALWDYSLKAQAAEKRLLNLQGAFSAQDENFTLDVASSKFGDSNNFVTLLEPFKVKYDGITLNATPARFNFGDTTIDLQIEGNSQTFNATMLWHIPSLESLPLSLTDLSLEGECYIDLHAGGPWNDPLVQGTAKIMHGSFENIKSGALFQHINADCAISNSGVRIVSFAAEDLSGGRINATGDMKFDSKFLLPFKVNLHFENAAIVNLEDAHCLISGDAIFLGDRLGASLSGDLNASKVDILLKDGKSSEIHNFEVTYINQPAQEKPLYVSKKSGARWPIQLNLHLISNGTISISDESLTSQWNGAVKLSGTDDYLIVQGDCRLQHGNYLFNGKKFKLTQGTIAFNGDPKKKTQLYIVGEQEVASIMVEVILKGPLQDLSLAFRSNPQLSEKEILCRMLFGRGTGEITPFQGSELTESINKMKSQGGEGPSFLSTFKKTMGLDRIEISHGAGVDNEEISLQVGKYLTPGVFIGVKKGITTDANRIGIEADLKKDVKIQAEYGNDSVGHLHLKWKHDY